ncbi:hypothetical protein TNCV_5001741 [Trichonephila clavipes]|nr:hypothetical protein TNCV_5001741 [Trichonephila clavipes]
MKQAPNRSKRSVSGLLCSHQTVCDRISQPDGQNNSAEKQWRTKEELPCLLRFDWPKPIDAESGHGNGLGRFENKRPETRSWN